MLVGKDLPNKSGSVDTKQPYKSRWGICKYKPDFDNFQFRENYSNVNVERPPI